MATPDEHPGHQPPRRLRADARRNVASILSAAESAFAAKGPAASTEEIARAAGVAIGTVFRHFPTKASLVEAVFVERLRELADVATGLADADDPGGAFFDFLAGWTELAAAKHTFAAALADDGVDVDAASEHRPYLEVRAQLFAAVGVVLQRAQAAGAVRDDIGVEELNTLMLGAARMVDHARADDAVRDRALAVVRDGLRPQAVPGGAT